MSLDIPVFTIAQIQAGELPTDGSLLLAIVESTEPNIGAVIDAAIPGTIRAPLFFYGGNVNVALPIIGGADIPLPPGWSVFGPS